MTELSVPFEQACGKVILLGEHAVVYGVPAIAVGIDRGASARVARPSDGGCELHVLGWDIRVRDAGDERDLARAFRSVVQATRASQRALGAPVTGDVCVEASANLPPGGGLGCSAAMGVAIARALDPAASVERIVHRAMEWEGVFHGNASGIDANVSARGGCIHFKRGEGIVPVRVRGGLVLCIGDTGIASGTKAMVESVARLREREPEVVGKAFERIGALTNNARFAIESGDKFALGRLMDQNQTLLRSLLVSTAAIERMCDVARNLGALGAKLTGAGGGGSVVALASNVQGAERVLDAWKREGFSGFSTRVAPAEVPAIEPVREVAS